MSKRFCSPYPELAMRIISEIVGHGKRKFDGVCRCLTVGVRMNVFHEEEIEYKEKMRVT